MVKLTDMIYVKIDLLTTYQFIYLYYIRVYLYGLTLRSNTFIDLI